MKKICISKDWFFRRPGAQPEKIDLPHDYAIGAPRTPDAPGGASNGFFVGGRGEYVKFLTINAPHAILDFDGAYCCAEYFFNEDWVALHPHGHTPFLVDVSGRVVPGTPNRIRVLTNDMQPSTRWYSGAGLYRDVFLWTGGAVRIEPRDLFVRTVSANAELAEVAVDAVISADRAAHVTLTVTLADAHRAQALTQTVTLHAEAGKTPAALRFAVPQPKLWDTEHPNLYTLTARVEADGVCTDEAELPFGIRVFTVSAADGLRLNGEPIKLRGGCIHHDHGVLGAAAFPAAEERKAARLKAAGYNALRIAHNPPSLALLEVCDRLGLIVMDEAFDMWNNAKNSCDYHLFFADWWARDIAYMVLRDRNHPSVLAYSIGNEIVERDGNSDGAVWAQKLADEIRRYDPTRPVTSGVCGFGTRGLLTVQEPGQTEPTVLEPKAYVDQVLGAPKAWDQLTAESFADRTAGYMAPLDIVGYNYLFEHYEASHARFPERVIWGSETHALNFYKSWAQVTAHPYVIGDFTWTAYDNLGEAGTGRFAWAREGHISGISLAGYPFRMCYQGDLDICGYRRPQSYFRAAIWKPDAELAIFTTHPMHNGEAFSGTGWHWYDVLDTWTFPQNYIGVPVTAEVYSTADEVVFTLNGREAARTAPVEAIARVQIPYEPGTLVAQAIRGGQVVAEAALHTVSAPYAVQVSPEAPTLRADRRDLCWFDITVTDENGARMPDARSALVCAVDGGELMGVFSEDPCNEDAYTSPACHAYHGRAVAVVRTAAPGTVTLTVSAPGLHAGTAAVKAE